MNWLKHYLTHRVCLAEWQLLCIWLLNGFTASAVAIGYMLRLWKKKIAAMSADYRARWEFMLQDGKEQLRNVAEEYRKRAR